MGERTRVGDFVVDHAIIAGSSLSELESAFNKLGLRSEYGGEHEHDDTHNSLIGFVDGSYLELISSTGASEPDKRAEFIREDVGPCGLAVETSDLELKAEEIRNRSVPVTVSDRHERETPNGNRAIWQLAYLGNGEPGTSLPFLIEDLSPRTHRIKPTEGIEKSGITGIDSVVVGTESLAGAIDRYCRAFGLPEPERVEAAEFGAEIAIFPDTAVVLAEPTTDGWLESRVTRYGELPCCVCFATNRNSIDEFDPIDTTMWIDRTIGWLSPESMSGRIGVVEHRDG